MSAQRVVLATEDDRQRWDTFVGDQPLGSVYHTYYWRDVICRAYGHKPQYFMLVNSDDTVCGVLPTFAIRGRLTGARYCALPGAQFASPLVGVDVDCAQLLDAALAAARVAGANYLEINARQEFPFCLGEAAVLSAEYFSHQLDLTCALDDIWRRFHKSCVARAIRKANASDLRLRTDLDLDSFYPLYSRMRRRKGLLPQPRPFFEALHNVFARHGMIDVLCAVLENRPVAAILVLKYRDTVFYEYGAMEPAARYVSPMHLLLWQAIQAAKRDGATVFDLGRTSSDNPGLRQFKQRWGACESRICTYLLGSEPNGISFRDRHGARMAMALAVRICPAAVTHAISRMLYRQLV